MRDLFSFPRRERPGILLLCVLLVLTAALPMMFNGRPKPIPPQLAVVADSFFQASREKDSLRGSAFRYNASPVTHGGSSLSWFDPNTLQYSDWVKLGLPDRSIRTIMHYLEKGGRFRRPDDLGRIWGLPPSAYMRLRPYVRIPVDGKTIRSEPDRKTDTVQHRSWTQRPVPKRVPIEVNQADSLQWLDLPGIGEKLTSRILRFRERLGGFCTVDQVGETWGLPDSTFQKIRPMLSLSAPATRKIPLNTAPEDLLQQHPYIRYKLARVIIRYRQEHGPFAAVADLRRIALITDELYARLEPYCAVN